MSKLKTTIIIAIALILIASATIWIYIGISSDVDIPRAIEGLQDELHARISGTPMQLFEHVYDLKTVDITADYEQLHLEAQLLLSDETAVITSPLFDGESYGITHNFGADMRELFAFLAAQKPELESDEGDVLTATYNATHERFGDVFAELTIIRGRIARAKIRVAGLAAEIDLGDGALADWSAIINGVGYLWRVSKADELSDNYFKFGDKSVTIEGNSRTGSFSLRTTALSDEILLTGGTLRINDSSFELTLSGNEGFELVIASSAKATTLEEFVDIGGDWTRLGDAVWAALEGLY